MKIFEIGQLWRNSGNWKKDQTGELYLIVAMTEAPNDSSKTGREIEYLCPSSKLWNGSWRRSHFSEDSLFAMHDIELVSGSQQCLKSAIW